MGNERPSDGSWLDARRVWGHGSARGRAVFKKLFKEPAGAGNARNWQAGIVRIFGKGRHRPSASWRQATDRAFTLIGDGRYEGAWERC